MRIDTKQPVNCPSCNGTGLYQGFCEQHDEAAECQTCDGKGYVNYVEAEAFTGRREKRGIEWVTTPMWWEHGAIPRRRISLAEWLRGKHPNDVSTGGAA